MKTEIHKEAYESPISLTLSIRTEGVLCSSETSLFPTTVHESFMGDGTYEW